MSTTIAHEKRMLTTSEFEAVEQTHHPQVGNMTRDDLLALVKRIRSYRDKARDVIRARRREHRGKTEQRGATPAPSETGISRKKQAFAAATRRVNKEIERKSRSEKPSSQGAIARRALKMKRDNQVRHHPAAGRTADEGISSVTNPKKTVEVDPREIGRVSEQVKVAQAKRDS